jgi:hypothetical protein
MSVDNGYLWVDGPTVDGETQTINAENAEISTENRPLFLSSAAPSALKVFADSWQLTPDY